MKNNYLYILLTITLIYSCSSGPDRPVNNPLFDDGYFVTNEGNFGSGNGSVSFISNNGSVQNDVFYNTNMFYLGDVVQSMTTANDKGYIVVNNSGKVEVVDNISKKKPLYETDKTICGLIFNQHQIENTVLPQFERDNIEKICDFIVKTLEGK